ncbi:MAG: methyltransferase domain-containing protein [Brevundimonas sp.]
MSDPATGQLDFHCPACRGPVASRPDAYRCEACCIDYPILHGIPDFRLRSDLYLTLDQEREKAARLAAFARTHSFTELLAFYYSITNDVPPERVDQYAGYAAAGPERASAVLADLAPFRAGDRLLDVGCGAGGMMVAAARQGVQAVGVDIALRWLVIARKHLESLGLEARLVCADAEALPFADGGFTHVAAVDVVEHARDPDALVAECGRQLADGGRLWISATNRLWLGPHPAVGLWAAGWMPARLRTARLIRLCGVDSLRFVHLLSPFRVMRTCRERGLRILSRRPRAVSGGGALRQTYARLSTTPGISALLFAAGPAFQMIAARPRGDRP